MIDVQIRDNVLREISAQTGQPIIIPGIMHDYTTEMTDEAMTGTMYSASTILGKESIVTTSTKNFPQKQTKSMKFTSSSEKELIDQASVNLKTTIGPSESSIDDTKNFAHAKLNAKLRNSIN